MRGPTDPAWVRRWRELVESYVSGDLDVDAFHDRFFDVWHASDSRDEHLPSAIEALFYVVESYSPDPTLRRPGDAEPTEIRTAAVQALHALRES